MADNLHLSIVTSVYQSAGYIEEFYSRIINIVRVITNDYELIFVNDGSNDDILDILNHLRINDQRISIINLTKNFGQHPALWAGIKASRGNLVFVIDCDLEESPEHLEHFYQILCNEHADMVFAAQKTRNGSHFSKFSGNIFYWLLRQCTDFKVVPNVLMMRLMTRQYVNSMLQFVEYDPRMTIIAYMIGFKTICIPIEKKFKGTSSYTFSKKCNEACDYLVGISNKPLYYILYSGLSIFMISIAAGAEVLLSGTQSTSSWILCGMGIMTGLLMISTGIVAIYVGRIFLEVRHPPLPMVKEIIR